MKLGTIAARVALVASIALSCLWAPMAAAQAPKQLRFGLLPAEDAGKMVEQFKGIADHVGAKMGLPVTVQVSESYNALIEAMRAGHLEVVYVGGSQYVKMREIGMDAVPVVINRDEDGRAYYKSCVITRTDSPIKTFNDLKGKTFAFVTPTSTSGGIAPTYLLLRNKIDPSKDFKNALYAGKHDAVLLAVKNKKVDAGAVGDLYFVRWAERDIFKMGKHDEAKDQLIDSEIRIIGCIRVPNTPMVTLRKFGDKFVQDLQAAFISVPKEVAGNYRIWGTSTGFMAAKHEDFLDLVEMEKLADQAKKK
jgi:phosphonate transport system substrate-binding protein